MSKRDRVVIVVAVVCWLLILGAVFLLANTHCAAWIGTLLDTGFNCVSEPSRPRASDTDTFRWKGHDYMIFNRGNELGIYNVDNPSAPVLKAQSNFRFGTRGDSDYDLIDFDVTDEGRFMVLSHKVKRTVIVDLGTGAVPAFPPGAWTFYDGVDSKIGGYVFSKGGQEYLIAALPGGCVSGSGLYTLDSTAAPVKIGCVQVGGTEALIKGLREFATQETLWLFLGGQAGQAHVFRADGGGAALSLVWQASPVGMWGRRYELSIDKHNALLASANFTLHELQLWDISNPAAPIRLDTEEVQLSNVSMRSAGPGFVSSLVGNTNGWPLSTKSYKATAAGIEGYEQGYWSDGTLPHNDQPVCVFDNGIALSKNGKVMYLARYAMFQVHDLTACLVEPTPTPTPTPIPNEIFSDGFESGDRSRWSTPTPTPVP